MEKETAILVNIKEKMKLLKRKQSELKKDFQEPQEHYQGLLLFCT